MSPFIVAVYLEPLSVEVHRRSPSRVPCGSAHLRKVVVKSNAAASVLPLSLLLYDPVIATVPLVVQAPSKFRVRSAGATCWAAWTARDCADDIATVTAANACSDSCSLGPPPPQATKGNT